MICALISVELTDEQKGQIYGILSVGCDRQTAANFVSCSLADIRRAMRHDATFAAGICRAEAGAEMNHMRNIQQAAKEEKNWRASVWWLERRSPERFGPRGPGIVTSRQLKAFIEILADVLREDVRDADERQQVLARLSTLAGSVNQMLRDNQLDLSNAAASPGAVSTVAASDESQDSIVGDGMCSDNYSE
jgi:hypothetical protein